MYAAHPQVLRISLRAVPYVLLILFLGLQVPNVHAQSGCGQPPNNPPVFVTFGSPATGQVSELEGWYTSSVLGKNDYGNNWGVEIGGALAGALPTIVNPQTPSWPPAPNTQLKVTAGWGGGSVACVAQNPQYDWGYPMAGVTSVSVHVDMPGAQIISTSGTPQDTCVSSDRIHYNNAQAPSFIIQYPTTGTKTITVTSVFCSSSGVPSSDTAGQAIGVFNVATLQDPGPCEEECEQAAGQPINLTTGDVWTSHVEYSVPGLAGGLSLKRTWNSQWSQANAPFVAGMFGMGWTSTFEERLIVLDNSHAQYWPSSGNAWLFTSNGCSIVTQGCTWPVTGPPTEHASLSYNSTTNFYVITFADGSQRSFNESSSMGIMTSIQDRNGNTTNIAYDSFNRISQVTAPGGQSLTFTYGNSGDPNRVTSIQDSVGTVATYTYSNSMLMNVTYADGGQQHFAYDSNNNITSITDDQAKVIETHTYDSSSRGLTSSRANGVDAITVSYSNGSTNLTNSQNNTTTYNYSTIRTDNYLTGIVGPGCDSCGGRNNQTFNLNSSGYRQSTTDPNGNSVSYTYDGNGNALTRTDAIGTWTYTYNSFNEVLTAKDPLGNTTTNT